LSTFDETFDFVVVGSGGGSMCCALALRNGGKSVLILEKTSLIGGTTARSGGVMWIPNNRFMRRDGVVDSREQSATYMDAVIGDHNDTPGATKARRDAYIDNGTEMVDFLVAQGIKLNRVSYWPDYYDNLPGGSEEGRTVVAELFNINELGEWKEKLRPNFLSIMGSLDHMLKLRFVKQSWESKKIAVQLVLRTIGARLTGQHLITAGGALQGRMLQASLRAGVELRTDAEVKELIFENGKVTGVMVNFNGKPHRVGSKLGVLINAGGFAHNQKMRDDYQPGTQAAWTMTAEGDTGEMILEMMRHGAAIAQMEEMVGNQISIVPGTENDLVKPVVQGMTASPHAILVDQTGVRYMNESGSYMTYCQGMLARNKTVPAIPSWAIFDSQYVKNYMIANQISGKRKRAKWLEDGYLHKGDTLEELAVSIKVDPVALRTTVARFNEFVTGNKDEDFNRGESAYDRWLGDRYHQKNASLGSISEGPFYAVHVLPGDVGTYGGVVCDAHARVLRENGTPIEGLYATGISTASVMGRSYPGAGASVGPSFVWGYVTAKHVLGHA
jgi:3-oxosteroid 1-dehydrogenase